MIGSWDWDVAADRVSWSDQLYRIYNLEPQEFAATYQAFLDFVHPEDRALVERAVTSTFDGPDEFSWDARIIRKGGEVRWIRGLGRVERGPDGLPIRMEGTSQDITDVVRADTVAAAATRRLVLLHELATAANGAQALAEAFAMTADAIAEHSEWSAICAYTVPGPDPDVSVGGAQIERVLLSGRPGGAVAAPDDALARRALGSGVLEHGAVGTPHPSRCLVAVPVLLDDRVRAVIEVVVDEASPSPDSRRLLAQIAGQLALVAERELAAAQLAEARDEAMEASRLKSEFLATMSHEIRTPMNGVIGLNDLLLRTALDEHQRRLAEGLQSAGLTLLDDHQRHPRPLQDRVREVRARGGGLRRSGGVRPDGRHAERPRAQEGPRARGGLPPRGAARSCAAMPCGSVRCCPISAPTRSSSPIAARWSSRQPWRRSSPTAWCCAST